MTIARVAGLLRVSGQEQLEGYSIAAQRHAIGQFCAARGWPAPEWHEEPAISAWTDDLGKRPVFAALLAAAPGRYDAIIVHKLDRFARSVVVALRELQRLERSGVAFASVAEQMDFTTPIGRVVLTMLAAFAQYYSDNLSAEVRKGLAEKRRQGEHVGRPGFGARRLNGHLTVDPARADDLKQALELTAALSPLAAADELNRRGIRPPTRRAALWGPSSVMVLRGPAGAWLLGQGEPWASLYEAARSRPRKPSGGAVTKTSRMLTGLMRCACGGAVSYHSVLTLADGSVRRHARCRDGRGRQGCHRWGRDADQIEAAVTDWLFALPDPAAEVLVPDDPGRVAALERRRQKLAEMYRDEVLTPAEYQRERDALRRELARQPATGERREAVAEGLRLARESWADLPEAARRAFLAGLVETFVLDNGCVTPVWRPGLAAVFGDEEEQW